MSLADLGKRIWHVTQEHGKAILQDVEKNLRKDKPRWERMRGDLKYHSGRLRSELGQEFRHWLEDELKKQGASLHSLWGHDPELERSYQLLGLPYGTGLEQVKQRWRALLKENHPDRYMSDPQAYAQATETTQHLTAAYHHIQKAKEQGVF